MTARYYVQGDEIWRIDAPGGMGDSPVFFERWDYAADVRERNHQFWVDVVAAMRQAGICEPQDRVGEQ